MLFRSSGLATEGGLGTANPGYRSCKEVAKDLRSLPVQVRSQIALLPDLRKQSNYFAAHVPAI